MKHYFWVFFEKAGLVSIRVLSIALLARVLSPADFGVYAMVAVLVTVATMLVDSGMAGSLIRKKNISEIDYSTVFIFNFLASLLLYLLIFTIAPFVSAFYKQENLTEVLRLLALVLMIRALGITYVARLTRELSFKPQAFLSLGAATVSLSVTYVLAIKGFGVWSLVVQQLIEAALFVIGLVLWARHIPRLKFSLAHFKQHFGFGSKLMCSSMTDALAGNIATIVVGRSLGVLPTGYYSQASKVNEVVIGLMSTIIDKAAFPLMVRHTHNGAELAKYAIRLLAGGCFVGFFVTAMISSCSSQLVLFLLGDHWIKVSWILQIIALSGGGMIIDVVVRNVLKTMGKADVILWLSLIKALFALIALVLASFYGFESMVWGVVICSLFNALIGLMILNRSFNLPWWNWGVVILKPLMASVIILIVSFWWRPLWGGSPIYSLMAMGLSGAFTYLSLTYIFGVGEAKLIVQNLTVMALGSKSNK